MAVHLGGGGRVPSIQECSGHADGALRQGVGFRADSRAVREPRLPSHRAQWPTDAGAGDPAEGAAAIVAVALAAESPTGQFINDAGEVVDW